MGAFGDAKKEFYFWNTDPRNWSEMSYQARSVGAYNIDSFEMSPRIYNPVFLALGAFTLNALPEGTVEPKGRGTFEICVNKVYYFINDSFDFEGEQWLGDWSLEFPRRNLLDSYRLTRLRNSDFRGFQRHGYGGYFPVLSKLLEFENLKPYCWTYPREKKEH